MTTQVFFKASSFISSKATETLKNVQSLEVEKETDAYAHWDFKNDSNSLVDLIGKKTLVVQDGASVQPLYTDTNVQLSLTQGNSLITPLTDTSTQSFTLAAVVKVNQESISILFGNLVQSPNTLYSGTSGFTSNKKGYVTVKPSKGSPASANGVSSLDVGIVLDTSKYMFLAVTVDKTTKKASVFISQGSQSFAEKVYTAPKYENTNKLAVGNAFYKGKIGTANYSEFVMFDKALTLNQLESLKERALTRSYDKNITF